MRCKIADLQVEMFCHPETQQTANAYACAADGPADITISPEDYAALPIRPPAHISEAERDYGLSGLCFSRQLPEYQGLVLHASAVLYREKAYLFTAPSGMGKSTHAALWCKAFPGCVILNDDKPALRVRDGVVYVYGTPWAGKHRIQQNLCAPLGGICLLHRGETDAACPAAPDDALLALYGQVGHTALTAPQMEKLLSVLESVIKQAPIYHLYCTPTIQAAELAYRTLIGEIDG